MNEREIYRVRWGDGFRTLKYLYRNPNDIARIASLIESMQGRSIPRLLERLRGRTRGRDLLGRKPSLGDALKDLARLRALPRGTLGREYAEVREQRSLKQTMMEFAAQGETLARSESLPPDERYIQEFLVFSHDLYHLVTGYETDLVGEVCLLGFTAAQTRNTGVFAMMFLGMFALRLPRLKGQRLTLQAFGRGMKARWLCEQDWTALLERPIDELRAELKLGTPPTYERLWTGRGQSKRARAYREQQRARGAAA
jgi:ubiquinone biosynthesis protein COQ4